MSKPTEETHLALLHSEKAAAVYAQKYLGVKVKVPAGLLADTGTEEAKYRERWGKKHHVTILRPEELARLKKDHDLGHIRQVFNSVPLDTLKIKPDPLVYNTARRTYNVLPVEWPEAQQARAQFGLRPASFHVTVGATEKKIEDVQYAMKFPKAEHKELQARLEQDKPIFTTRVSQERGKYEAGMTIKTPWGAQLRVAEVTPIGKLRDHPFVGELSPKQKAQLSGKKMDLVRLEKIAELAEDGEHKLQGHIDFKGLHIAVENRKGSVRSGKKPDGGTWRTEMKAHYGYLEAPAKGKDGESLDVYVGPKKDADTAFVVHQHKPDGTGHDEDKIILGTESEEEAKKLYLKHYDSPKFLGPVSAVSVESLKKIIGKSKKIPKLTEKLAMAPSVFSSAEESRKVLQPGDILVTKQKAPPTLWKPIEKVLESFQHTPFYHAAIYAGDGNVVHAQMNGVTKMPLKKFHEMYEFKAYRVNAEEKVRDEAARFAKSTIGKRSFSIPQLVSTTVPWLYGKESKKEREKLRDRSKVICSSLIAAAFPKLQFGNRAVEAVRPVDLAKSRLTNLVGESSGVASIEKTAANAMLSEMVWLSQNGAL